jgi:hypothetical protein
MGNRSAALLGAGTWRWNNLPEDLQNLEPLWPGLFNNLLRWMSAREDDRPLRVRPVQDLFDGDQDVVFTGQAYDESLEPVSDAQIQIQISGLDGNPRLLDMEPIGNGRYTANAGRFPESTYTYLASAARSGSSLGEDRGSFAVGRTSLEYRDIQADHTTMRQIAARSGGQLIAQSELDMLDRQLADQLTEITREQRTRINIWRMPGILVLIISLLAGEWVIRKRAGMV